MHRKSALCAGMSPASRREAAAVVDHFNIFVETGKRWVFAGAIGWPGWCRRGKDESSAKDALLEGGSRYARALAAIQIDFEPPQNIDAFNVVERVAGNSTTDFGAPDAALEADEEPVSASDLERFSDILEACWAAFDRAVEKASGRELRKGPRGGGRVLDKIINHVVDGDASYLGRIGWPAPKVGGVDHKEKLEAMRAALLEGLAASARGELPTKGPRGGLRWSARRFVRRVAWHALDHAWEIEDRLE